MTNFVISSGVSSAYQVGDEDTLTVLSGGRSDRSVVTSGGVEVISSGAFALGDVISSGGIDVFHRGGTENDVTVRGGGVLDLADAVVRDGASLNVSAIAGAQQFAGVTLDARAAFWSLDAVVGNSGAEFVGSGGLADATTVTSGGELVVSRGGLVDGATVGIDASLDNAGTLSGAFVDRGQIVYSGGAASTLGGSLSGAGKLLDEQAAELTVSAGAASFTGTAELQQGVLDLATAEGLGKGRVDFLANGDTKTLRIEADDTPASGRLFASPLESFDAADDRLDLRSVAFVKGATATVSGSTLTVRDGTYTAAFTLTGSKAAAYVVGADGAGGILVHAAATPSAAALTEAAAGFGAPSQAPAHTAFADTDRSSSMLAGASAMSPHALKAS